MQQYKLLQGDCLAVLKTLPDESVQMCCTSPPYYGLRDYGFPPLIWDGLPSCEHEWVKLPERRNRWIGEEGASQKQQSNRGNAWVISQGSTCSQCNAWCGSLGLEPTPDLYIQHLVQIFREVRRVLKRDGTLWCNIGDSYAGSGKGFGGRDHGKLGKHAHEFLPAPVDLPQLAPKNLIGIPWHLAFALQANGWVLRSDIIWSKPNAMPESVRDRPTKGHEYLFLLAKSNRYFYNADAIKEPVTEYRSYRGTSDIVIDAYPGNPQTYARGRSGFGYAKTPGRNKRSVWSIATQPSHVGSHFAVMPTKLVEPCILAGSRPGDTVLDPFCGAATVLLVASQLERSSIGIELNPDYIALAHKRIEKHLGLWQAS